jgi:two-component system sensor histidine kinase ChvG
VILRRLLLVNMLIVAVPIVGIGFARTYERELLRGLERDLIDQATIARAALADDPSGAHMRAAMRARGFTLRIWKNGADDPPAYVARALAGRYGAGTVLEPGGKHLWLHAALPTADGGAIEVARPTTRVMLSLYRLRGSLVRVFVGALAITCVLSIFLSTTISRPLARLTRIAERIAAGDRRESLSTMRKDEIGRLSRAFAIVTERLDGRARDVADLAADLSHELKSPLTSVRGAAELLLDGAGDDPDTRRRFVTNILDDAHRLDRLVTRILELSRVEADAAPDERVDLVQLAREIVAVDLVVDRSASDPIVLGRRAHLAAALSNLVDNARQHAAPGTRVTVTIDRDASRALRVRVHNQGAPIRAAHLLRLWDRFFTTRANEGGTGLGLAIVASVVRAHGGAVSVASDANSGTTFAFTL